MISSKIVGEKMSLISLTSKNVKISASTTSANAQVPLDCATTVRITNSGTDIAYVTASETTPTATTAGLEILPGATESFSFNPAHKYVAAIMASGTGTIGFTFSVDGV